jgi:putative MATE family efflux protein
MQLNMTEGKPLPILLRFMFPVFLGNLFQQFYNMVDAIIVGRFIGAGALAAVGSTGTIMFLVLGIAAGLSTGFTILTSQKYGAGDTEGTKYSVSGGIILTAGMTVLITAVSLFVMHPLLHLMNTPQDIYADAYSYISVICIGVAASMFYNLFSSYLRAVGNSKVPLYFLILSACLNVVLDLLFVVTFRMGVAGAAWATDLSQAISAILCGFYIFRKVPVLTPDRSQWRLKKAYVRNQLGTAVPMALQFGITASGTIIMQAAINQFGSLAVAGTTAANKVFSLFSQGMVSIGQTMASYAGQNYGRGCLKRIRQGCTVSMLAMAVYSVFSTVIGILCMPVLINLFIGPGTDISEILPYSMTYMYISVSCLIFLSMIFIYRNALQGCGFALSAMMGGVAELAARLLCAWLSMILGSYPLAVGCDGAAWIAAGILLFFLYRKMMKKLDSRIGSESIKTNIS